MFGLIGTFVNAGAVILGGVIGLLLNKGIPQRLNDSVFKALALITMFIGISGCTKNFLPIFRKKEKSSCNFSQYMV